MGLLSSDESGPATPASDEDEDREAVHVAGMERTSPALAEKAEREAAERRAAEAASALEAPIADSRLKALKEKARRDIESRLLAHRKRRRLLRGGEAP